MAGKNLSGLSLAEIWKSVYRLRRDGEAEIVAGAYFDLKSGEPGPGQRCVLVRCYPMKNDAEAEKPGWRWVFRGEVRPVPVDVVAVETSRSGQTVLVVAALDLRTGKRRGRPRAGDETAIK